MYQKNKAENCLLLDCMTLYLLWLVKKNAFRYVLGRRRREYQHPID